MKRLVIVAALGALCVFATAAVAGDYHNGTTLICSDCHVMHGSQSHALTSGGFFVPIGANGPYADLLRNDVNDLCLTCHDNSSFAPDVFGANGGVARVRPMQDLSSTCSLRPNRLPRPALRSRAPGQRLLPLPPRSRRSPAPARTAGSFPRACGHRSKSACIRCAASSAMIK